VNGHALGERAAWVLAATLVAFGSTTGSIADRPAGEIAAASSTVHHAAVAAAVATPTKAQPAPGAGLAADAMGWPARSPAASKVTAPPPKPALPAWVRKYHGANHVWMPTLGVTNRVYAFPCSRSRDPDNLVYRWGCAGTNNVYLLGHAYGVFRALNHAYYNGRLKVGMPVVYADGHGRLHLYRVTTWRIVRAVDAHWAIAAQRVPSMSLQTCIGSSGTLRLVVRLVEANA
jgi:hypothetical protein